MNLDDIIAIARFDDEESRYKKSCAIDTIISSRGASNGLMCLLHQVLPSSKSTSKLIYELTPSYESPLVDYVSRDRELNVEMRVFFQNYLDALDQTPFEDLVYKSMLIAGITYGLNQIKMGERIFDRIEELYL